MCGVAVVLRSSDLRATAIAGVMIELAKHRGPDGLAVESIECGGGVDAAFGHARLAVLGLGEQGAQPMTRGAVTLVYNGELYNCRALGHELQRLGHTTTGTSDTEVLALAWSQWGPTCLARLDGMFAFVLWDGQRRRFFAARDRFGIKPLHYVITTGGIAIASEIKQFKAIPEWTPTLDRTIAGAFLQLGIHDSDETRTFFAGVNRVTPGTLMVVDPLLCRHPTFATWATLETQVQSPSANYETECIRTRACVEQSIRDHLIADVPVGSCLSGGTDSSILVGCAAPHTNRTMQLFHARTIIDGLDESRFARAVARDVRAQLHEVEISAEAVRQCFDACLVSQDEPFSSTSVCAQWILMQSIRSAGISVVLDGQGADEMFMGYMKYQFAHLRDLRRSGRWFAALQHACNFVRRGDHAVSRVWSQAQRYLPQRWRSSASFDLPAWARDPIAPWERFRMGHPSAHETQLCDVSRWSLPLLLRYEDRNSMAHGVEARVPFVSTACFNHATTVGAAVHLHGGRNKADLREGLRSFLPVEVAARTARLGYVTGWSHWSQPNGELSSWLQSRLRDSKSMRALVGDPALTPERIRAIQSSRVGRDQLFRWIAFSSWADQWSIDVS